MLLDAEAISPEDHRTVVELCRADPLFFSERVLGGEAWGKQEELMEAVRDHARVCVRSGHGVGKTWVAARICLWFLYSFPPAVVVTLAPTWRQVETILWGEIRRQHALALVPLMGRPVRSSLVLAEDWYARGVSTNEPERLQGIHGRHVLVVVDEAVGVKKGLFEAAEGILTSEHSRLLLIGNPTRTEGNFYDAFSSPLYEKLHISCEEAADAGLVSRKWIEDRKREWGEGSPLYLSRVLGEFPEEADDSLLSAAEVLAAARAWSKPEEGTHSIGVDVARFGEDETVIVVLRRQGGVSSMVRYLTWRRRDLMQTCGEVTNAIREFSVAPSRVRIDDTGLGGGLVDRLRELGFDVAGVNFGARARNRERFSNKRAEMLWNLRKLVKTGSLKIILDPGLIDELKRLRYKVASDGRITIEPKKKGKSPDRAEALALACYEEESPQVYAL